MKVTKKMIVAGAKALFESRDHILKWEYEEDDRKKQYIDIAKTVLRGAMKEATL